MHVELEAVEHIERVLAPEALRRPRIGHKHAGSRGFHFELGHAARGAECEAVGDREAHAGMQCSLVVDMPLAARAPTRTRKRMRPNRRDAALTPLRC